VKDALQHIHDDGLRVGTCSHFQPNDYPMIVCEVGLAMGIREMWRCAPTLLSIYVCFLRLYRRKILRQQSREFVSEEINDLKTAQTPRTTSLLLPTTIIFFSTLASARRIYFGMTAQIPCWREFDSLVKKGQSQLPPIL
jgi:hypothetical protein